MHHSPIAAGGSSFDLIDADKLFAAIDVQPGMTFLDVACGYGYYSLATSRYVEKTGRVVAVDLWKDGIDHLMSHIEKHQIENIQAMIADATKHLPVATASVDICLLSTVLHDFILEKTEGGVLKEIHRVLKPAGKFAVIEFKKMESHPGPPIEIRITPEQVETKVAPFGFRFEKTVAIGKFNYLSLFKKQ